MPKTKIIKQDGVTYNFTPGENGGMVVTGVKQPDMSMPQGGKGKIVPQIGAVVAQRNPDQQSNMTPQQYAMRKKRSGIVQTLAVRD